MRVLTSDPSEYITRRLLSHLNHLETMASRRGTSYQCIRGPPRRVLKASILLQNRPLTRVQGYNLRALTSYPSKHVTRRLRSHLDHQETTTSRRGTSYQCSRASPLRVCETAGPGGGALTTPAGPAPGAGTPQGVGPHHPAKCPRWGRHGAAPGAPRPPPPWGFRFTHIIFG